MGFSEHIHTILNWTVAQASTVMETVGDTGAAIWLVNYFFSNSSHPKSREYPRMRQGRPAGVMHQSWWD